MTRRLAGFCGSDRVPTRPKGFRKSQGHDRLTTPPG